MILKDQFTKLKAHWAKEKKLEAQIEKKQKQLRKLENSPASSWTKTLLEPLAKAIAEARGFKHWEIMGPFGLGNETSLWFWNEPEERENCKVRSITFRPDLHDHEGHEPNPFGVRIKDYSKKNNNYPENSLGAVNGMNYGDIVPPADADLEWFLKLLDMKYE